MATRQGTVDAIVEASGGAVSARKMFGEVALYRGAKVVALVCDDRLFVKPTPAGRALVGEAEEAPPYPGAKPCLVVPGERWDDGEWLADLFRATAEGLPPPAAKRPRRPQGAAPGASVPASGAPGPGSGAPTGAPSRKARSSSRDAKR